VRFVARIKVVTKNTTNHKGHENCTIEFPLAQECDATDFDVSNVAGHLKKELKNCE
jgi:hypothetical protein